MSDKLTRKDFLRLVGLGGVAFASGLRSAAFAAGRGADDFFFVQISDTHWGYSGPQANPEARTTLPRAVAAVNGLGRQPDFVVFTGDLTHTTDDDKERRRRLTEFRDIVSRLKAKHVRLMPGEHDAALDEGAAFKEVFGQDTRYVFDHKGIHFIALDNVSDPLGALGEAQLDWLARDLSGLPKEGPIVILAHRPLFDLAPQWDWATKDGARALELLRPFPHVTVFYGHIHQEHHFMTGHIAHHAAKSLIFPLPPPSASAAKSDRKPVPWDAARPFRGLGWRRVSADPKRAAYRIEERPLGKG